MLQVIKKSSSFRVCQHIAEIASDSQSEGEACVHHEEGPEASGPSAQPTVKQGTSSQQQVLFTCKRGALQIIEWIRKVWSTGFPQKRRPFNSKLETMPDRLSDDREGRIIENIDYVSAVGRLFWETVNLKNILYRYWWWTFVNVVRRDYLSTFFSLFGYFTGTESSSEILAVNPPLRSCHIWLLLNVWMFLKVELIANNFCVLGTILHTKYQCVFCVCAFRLT